MLAIPRTVQEEFKARHPSYLQRATLVALMVHLAIFVLSPPFEFKPYAFSVVVDTTLVEDVPDIEYPTAPPKVAPPRVVISHTDPTEENVTLPETSPDVFTEVPLVTKDPSTDLPFIAFDRRPEFAKFATPKYPSLAREAGIEGTVFVRVIVGVDGKVINASVLSSDVTPAMEQAALVAAKQSRFRPARQRHMPVKASVVIPYRFRLR